MLFRTNGQRFEVETDRTSFFLRAPIIGEVFHSTGEGWVYSPWRDVKAQLEARSAVERAEVQRREVLAE